MNVAFENHAVKYRFDPMDRITIEGCEVRLHFQNEKGYVFETLDGSGTSFQVTTEKMTRLASMGQVRRDIDFYSVAKTTSRLKASVTGMVADLHGKTQIRYSKKSAFVEAFRALVSEGKVKRTDKSIRENMDAIAGRAIKFAKNLNPSGFVMLDKAENFAEHPSPRSLRRWHAAESNCGPMGLTDQMAKRGNRSKLLGREEWLVMWKHIGKYAHPDRPTMNRIWEDIDVEIGLLNENRVDVEFLRAPSYETVRRHINTLDAYHVYISRHGREAARKKFRPVLDGLDIYRPGERIEFDEWTIDSSTISTSPLLMELMTTDERLAIGLDNKKARWVITVAIDVATRCILGMVLSKDPKGSAAVRCLEMVTQNKGVWSDGAGCEYPS